MSIKAKISILVPCYNVEKFLRQCMDSIVNQSFKDLEIICINDGSTDGTLEILQEYASRDERIVIIDKKNSGYGASMNMGLNAASGEYLGIVESDDYIEPDMFEKLYATAKEHDLDYVRCHFRYVGEVLTKSGKCIYIGLAENRVFSPAEMKKVFLIPPSIWAAMYRTDMLRRNDVKFLETPGASFQDTSFAFKTLASSKRAMIISDILHNYRINGDSSVSSPGKVFFVCDEDSEIRRWVNEKGLYEEYKEILARRAFGSYRWNYQRLKLLTLKRQFMERWSKEVRDSFRNGEITRTYFSFNRIFRLRIIAHCPWIYHFSKDI